VTPFHDPKMSTIINLTNPFNDLKMHRGNPKLGLTHSRCKALTVKCGIGMTAIGAAKRVAHILYTVLCSMC
jgi:hypothetical protein